MNRDEFERLLEDVPEEDLVRWMKAVQDRRRESERDEGGSPLEGISSADTPGALARTTGVVIGGAYEPQAAVNPDIPEEVSNLVVQYWRDEDGVWIAECLSIPGCMSQGDTLEEAQANVQDAIMACLVVRRDRGMPLTVSVIEIPQVQEAM